MSPNLFVLVCHIKYHVMCDGCGMLTEDAYSWSTLISCSSEDSQFCVAQALYQFYLCSADWMISGYWISDFVPIWIILLDSISHNVVRMMHHNNSICGIIILIVVLHCEWTHVEIEGLHVVLGLYFSFSCMLHFVVFMVYFCIFINLVLFVITRSDNFLINMTVKYLQNQSMII